MKTGRRTEFSRKNNSGFTLIELIIISVIIAVLASVIAINIKPMFTQSVRSSAEDLQQLMADTRTASYARGKGDDTYLEIETDANGRLKATEYVNGTPVTPYVDGETDFKYLGRYRENLSIKTHNTLVGSVSSDGKTVTNTVDSESAASPLPSGQKLFIAFEKGTGEIYCFSYAADWSSAAKNFNSGDSVSDAVITLEGNGSVFEVTADGLTGRSSYKRIYS